MKNPIPSVRRNPQWERSRQLVAGARSRWAELEVVYAREKSRADAAQAVLFRHLRGHNQKRDRLRLAVHYRQNFLDSFVRNDTDEVEQAERDLAQAKAQLDEDYTKMAAAAAKAKPLTAGQEAELARLWKKLVTLHQPGRFARQPDKLEAYHKLAAAIHQAKDSGDLKSLRAIAEDTPGFLLRQGWAKLDFGGPEDLTQLKRLRKALEKEIAAATASLNELRASPDYELCRQADQKPGMLEELAAERAKQLEAETVELELESERLAKEIRKLSGKT